MHFSNESETLIALVSVILSADLVGTTPERKYLFDHLGNQKPFRDLDRDTFAKMVARVNEQLFSEEDAVHRFQQPEGIAAFCTSVKACLSEERVRPAFRMACEIACADGLLPVEQNLLYVIGDHLELTKDEIGQILAQAEESYPLESGF